jgi:hypothetical protein
MTYVTTDLVDADGEELIPNLKKERAVVDNDAWQVQVSLKTPRGALINVRGKDLDELTFNLAGIKGMAQEILEAEAELFGGDRLGTQPMPPALSMVGAQPVQQGPAPSWVPQPQNLQQQPNAPMCQHNMPAKYVQGGISKTGRPYKAFWACAMPREQQCSFRQDG